MTSFRAEELVDDGESLEKDLENNELFKRYVKKYSVLHSTVHPVGWEKLIFTEPQLWRIRMNGQNL